MNPSITPHPLSRADGSVQFSNHNYTILSAVNAPIDVQRRDELPDEAYIEVHIRPLSGVGGPRERWLEGIVAGVLRRVVLGHLFPRTMVQVGLQVVKEGGKGKGEGDVCVLPALVNAAVLGLVDGGIPLATSVVGCLVGVRRGGEVVVEPGVEEGCESLHTFAFGLEGEMLLCQSVGRFGVEEWEAAEEVAGRTCAEAMEKGESGDDMAMTNGEGEKVPWLRQTLEEVSSNAQAWKTVG